MLPAECLLSIEALSCTHTALAPFAMSEEGMLNRLMKPFGGFLMSLCVVQSINALGKKARDGTIGIDDMAGGTFTISNGGVYGSLLSTPIINPPQSAILGMHSINQRPMVVGKEILARPVMNVALTYDHRLIDGREAVTFLKRIKDIIEDPVRLLLDC